MKPNTFDEDSITWLSVYSYPVYVKRKNDTPRRKKTDYQSKVGHIKNKTPHPIDYTYNLRWKLRITCFSNLKLLHSERKEEKKTKIIGK